MATKSTTLHPGTMARQIKENSSGGGVSPEVIQELEEDVERALLGNHVYSTVERVCGEWVDGRNIYEKTVVLDSALAVRDNGYTNIDALFPDVDIPVTFKGWDTTANESQDFKYYHGLKCYQSSQIDANVIYGQYVKSE